MTGTTLSIHPGREAETEHIWRDVGTFQKKAHSSYFSFPAAQRRWLLELEELGGPWGSHPTEK